MEDLIGSAFIPKLLGHDIPGGGKHDLFSLPIQLGSLGLFIPTVTAARQHVIAADHQSAFFMIMADERMDGPNEEELVLCFCWIDDHLVIHKVYIGLYQIKTHGSESRSQGGSSKRRLDGLKTHM